MKHVFIIGSKGIPANYGGFETFVDKLVCLKQEQDIQYYVACMGDRKEQATYKNAICFSIPVPSIGPAKAVYYDIMAFRWCLSYIQKNQIKDPVIYVLACRIGPFISGLKNGLRSCNGKLFINPDGHEWKRAKWNYWIKKYWKYSERLMVKSADLLVCDSKKIEEYIHKEYEKYHPKTTFIAYGTDDLQKADQSALQKLNEFYQKHKINENQYYLVVGRFVPENNYETMIREFMNSDTKKDFIIITNVENNKFYKKLLAETKFLKDHRIKFVGTVYDDKLLSLIRQHAFAYLHGHEVGGTNPSLLEALATTPLNLLVQVGFNEEVAGNGALYWNKSKGNLSQLINKADHMIQTNRDEYETVAKRRMKEFYSWEHIIHAYETLFVTHKGDHYGK